MIRALCSLLKKLTHRGRRNKEKFVVSCSSWNVISCLKFLFIDNVHQMHNEFGESKFTHNVVYRSTKRISRTEIRHSRKSLPNSCARSKIKTTWKVLLQVTNKVYSFLGTAKLFSFLRVQYMLKCKQHQTITQYSAISKEISEIKNKEWGKFFPGRSVEKQLDLSRRLTFLCLPGSEIGHAILQ